MFGRLQPLPLCLTRRLWSQPLGVVDALRLGWEHLLAFLLTTRRPTAMLLLKREGSPTRDAPTSSLILPWYPLHDPTRLPVRWEVAVWAKMCGKTTLWCPVRPRCPHCPKPKIGGGGGMTPVCMRFQPWGTPPWYPSRKRVFDHFSRSGHFSTIFYPLARGAHRYQAPTPKPAHASHTYPWSLHTPHWKAGPRGQSGAHEAAPGLTDPCFSRPRHGAQGGGGARRGPG